MQDGRVLSLCDGVSFQGLGDEEGAIVLIADTGQLYTCNTTTAKFLTLLDGNRTFAQLIDEVSSVYEVSREELYQDLSAMADKLIAEGLIQ
jgi:hypothetical protein